MQFKGKGYKFKTLFFKKNNGTSFDHTATRTLLDRYPSAI